MWLYPSELVDFYYLNSGIGGLGKSNIDEVLNWFMSPQNTELEISWLIHIFHGKT